MAIYRSLLNFFTKSTPQKTTAENLYWQIVDISRQQEIYQDFLIPDTFDGRFDSLLLHLFLVIEQLKNNNSTDISDELLNFFIKDMDRSLREIGVGDPSITRKMRKIGEAYMGRMNAYLNVIDNHNLLTEALHKNIYRQQEVPLNVIQQLAHYVSQYRALLQTCFDIKMPLPVPQFNTPQRNVN